uniref:M949_RS01915 family surface polysaccharide biosynthesis protein n=1 Tax=Escherichia coli TaxID=562 RepID=UPI0013CB7C72
FKARWQIEQETTCPGLDLDVDFYNDVSDVGDLNKDGIAEVTVASHAFCGGGIDPHDIAIEMREGQASYSITGQSLITPAGEEPIGGEREDI